MDTSSSMEEECYGELKMKKMDAVKELFDSFATRTMAYDFHHVIGLASFSSKVTVIHTFTENLEKFKVVFNIISNQLVVKANRLFFFYILLYSSSIDL